ncbi:MAG: hypothetical protein BM564_09565 [Bacteroidetes bacterium MedPE-SWsnd-G2]|nr:MAG: hypothetical protein BM564_09565 [Bacteroidetes bacterium MedPE-SWsnd-G2]
MKKAILILAVIVMPLMGFGQSIFDKFEDMEGVTSIVVNQKMFNMLVDMQINVDDPEAQEMVDMAKSITSLKVLTTDLEDISSEMMKSVNKYLNNNRLEELMRIKDGDQTIKFYVKEGKSDNHVKELLMVVSGLKEITKEQDITINGQKREFETVLLSLTGDIDLKQIAKLTNSMDMPGGEHLEKAGQAKQN